MPLLEWLERHQTPVPTLPKGAKARQGVSGRRRLALALGHNRLASQTGSLAQRSCLPWHPGAPIGGL